MKINMVPTNLRVDKSKQIKSLNSKTDISFFISLRYLRLKMLKNKENNKKYVILYIHHNFKNIPCYVISEVILKRFYYALRLFDFDLI